MNEQPAPTPNDRPAVWDLVMADMKARDELGKARYGTRLQAHNGRDALRDAYEEALDLAVYLRQLIFERDTPIEDEPIYQCPACNCVYAEHEITDQDHKCPTRSCGWQIDHEYDRIEGRP